MLEVRTCPDCGAEMPSAGPQGICVACLLRIGLDPNDGPVQGEDFGCARAGGVTDQRLLEAERPGSRIDRFKLLEKIGEGGCGIVYRAEQEEPVTRMVALKIIKLGMDTRKVVARFELERQTLALMDHPHIAKVLDAGATRLGRPYFVMELVRGVPITRYCDDRRLTVEARLQLFIRVCQAIQHAHQKGVIHRDIKPSNILVADHEDLAVPKIIDFGIAKATTDQPLNDSTVFTAFEQFLGTPAYMSPEQARLSGFDIDTRSDIYSLGVLLYELLTGGTPFDARKLIESGFDEIRRTILEVEPPRPSSRLNSLNPDELALAAGRRRTLPTRLVGTVRGDLDWIVMKCLEKDRSRRYETANGLARDLERSLASEPIAAHPPSAAYRFGKFVRRNKVAASISVAVAAVALFGIVLNTRETLRAKEAEREQRLLSQRAQSSQKIAAQDRVRAEQRLYESLVSEARALLAAKPIGYRESVFSLVRQANALNIPRKDTVLLRSEAVGCLGDFVGLRPREIGGFPTNKYSRQTLLSPKGDLIAFMLSDGSVSVRDFALGTEVSRLRGTNRIASFCFSATGDRIFTVHLYDPDDCPETDANFQAFVYDWARDAAGRWTEARKVLMPGAVRCLSSALGVFAYVLDFTNQTSQLVNLDTGAVLRRIPVPERFLDAKRFPGYPELALSADGRFLAVETLQSTNSEHSTVEVLNLATGADVARFEPRLAFLESLNFSPDGKYLGCLSQFGGAIYAIDKSAAVSVKGSYRSPSVAAFAANRNWAALTLTGQKQVRLWDWAKNEDVLLLHEPVSVLEALLDSSGDYMVTAGANYARVYSLKRLPEKLTLSGHTNSATAAAFSPDGRRFATVSTDKTLRLWDAASGALVWGPVALPGSAQVVAYSPAGGVVASGGFNMRTGPFWDAATGSRLLDTEQGPGGRVWAAQFSPNGRYFASAGDAEVAVWAIEDASVDHRRFGVRLLKSVPGPATSLVFAPDNTSVAFVDLFQSVYVWDIEGQAPPRRVADGTRFGLQALAFTPDSRQLFIGRNSGEIDIVDPRSGTEVAPCINLKRTTGPPRFCLSPDGASLAVVSMSNIGVEIWDTARRSLVYSLPEQNAAVEWLAWDPGSSRLAVCRDSGDIDIWDLKAVAATLAEVGLQP